MKLKLKDETQAEALGQDQLYARTLRVIGQDLSNLYPQFLEITVTGTSFQVMGRYVPRSVSGKESQQDNKLLSKLRTKFLGNQPGVTSSEYSTELMSFDRSYGPVDINRIDETESSRRNGADKAPDIYSLGEMLRMVGRIVDSDGNRLLRVSKDARSIIFEFESGDGQTQKNELSSLQLYKLQREYYAERGTYVPVDKWDGSV
ncbi:MAG: hypothetical protein OEN50_04050 [Deltaproteobacteria bacterium]|nr:hypothetical protein [Deltaproteobacteria bacterium]